VIEHLPNIYKALGSIPSTGKEGRKGRKEGRKKGRKEGILKYVGGCI
jgi:hypothetical protein